jgi:hypothetical protein
MPDEETRVVSETGGEKGSKQAQLGAIDPLALLELAKVAGFGAEKYDEYNYLKGYNWTLSINAASRHLLQFANGEDIDPVAFNEKGEQTGSGLSHVAHAAWNCLALVSFHMRGLGTDNRVSAFLTDQNSPSTPVMTIDFDVPIKADGWLEDDGSVTPIDWSNPAPDFWYYEYESDWPRILESEGDPVDCNIDEEEINLLDEILFHVLNPEIFGEFKPVEVEDNHYQCECGCGMWFVDGVQVPAPEKAKSPVLIDFGGIEEKPFKVGDKVEVHGYKMPATVSNIDWKADQLRLVFDAAEYVEWVNANRCTKVS